MIVDRLSLTRDHTGLLSTERFTAAIGSFDGVHRGHQYLLGLLLDSARTATTVLEPAIPLPDLTPFGAASEPDPLRDAEVASHALSTRNSQPQPLNSLVVTFDPLPFEVLHPEAPPSRLTDIDERIDLLAGLGIDRVCVVEFNRELAAIPPTRFLELLTARYDIRELWCGEDFAFGHNRAGTAEFLLSHAAEYGFSVEVTPRIDVSGARVGSRDIRRLVAVGQLEAAGELLGHPPTVSGPVIAGAQRGRQLGFPTANLLVPPYKLIPQTGIYAGYARLETRRYLVATSVGHNPTFGLHPLSVEGFILDFDREILGSHVTFEFAHRIRDELKFDSVDALVAQMAADVEVTRTLLDSRRSMGSHPR